MDLVISLRKEVTDADHALTLLTAVTNMFADIPGVTITARCISSLEVVSPAGMASDQVPGPPVRL